MNHAICPEPTKEITWEDSAAGAGNSDALGVGAGVLGVAWGGSGSAAAVAAGVAGTAGDSLGVAAGALDGAGLGAFGVVISTVVARVRTALIARKGVSFFSGVGGLHDCSA